MVLFIPGLLPKAMSGSVTLLQPGSVLMSIDPETIKDHCNDVDLVYHLGLRCQSKWPALTPGNMVTHRPGLLPRIMSGSVVLPQPRSVMMSMANAATKDHTDA